MTAALTHLGERIRLQRKRLKIAAQSAAEAAEISRVTLHRIERGEPTVAMGSYMQVLSALGLRLEIAGDTPATRYLAPEFSFADGVPLKTYPQLRQLAWQLPGVDRLPAQDALALYERNWRYVDHANMPAEEKALVEALVKAYGKGVLLV